MKKTSVYLPDELKAALALAAARSGRSEADTIRLALERFVLSSGAAPDTDPRSRRPVPSAPCLVGIGVGPGDPDLLTGRARRILSAADRVLAGSISDDAVGRAEAVVYAAAPGVPVERLVLHTGPDVRSRKRTLTGAAGRIAEYLDRGELVAFVTLGDPNLYSSFSSLADAVRALRARARIEAEPGIFAFQQLAAATSTTIAKDDERVTIVTLGDDASELSPVLAEEGSTVIVYKGGRKLPELAASLAARDRLEGAVAGELLGQPGERCIPLSEMATGPGSYLATTIVPARRGRPRGKKQ